MDPPPEQGGHVALPAGGLLGLIHIGPDPGEPLEIGADIVPGLLPRNRQLGGEAKGGNAIDNAEVDRLGAPADLGRHALDGNPEDLGGGHGVDVQALGEGGLQLGDVAHVGQ